MSPPDIALDANPTSLAPIEAGGEDAARSQTTRPGSSAAVEGGEEGEWPDIDLASYARLSFPMDVLPDFLRDYVMAVANYARVGPDSPALLTLAAIGAAAANRVVVRVGEELHPVHLWVLALLPTGVGKTPMLERVSAPFRLAQVELRAGAAGRVLGRRVDRRIARSLQNTLVRRLAALLPSNPDVTQEREAVRASLLELEGQLDHLADLPDPTLLCDDNTMPALVQLMASQGGTMTLLSAEGSAFFRSVAGAAASEPIEPLLQAHSGESIRVNRVSRAAISIERPALSLILGTQPTVVRRLLRASSFEGRGLWERFIFVEPEARNRSNIEGNADAFRLEVGMYASLISDLLGRSPTVPQELRLSSGARELLNEYAADIDRRLREGDLSGAHIQGWANKVRGNVIRLSAILHIAEQSEEQRAISRSNVEGAIKVMTMCISHARHVLGVIADVTDTQAILDWHRARKVSSISVRDLRRALQRQFPEVRLLQAALDDLEARGLVRVSEERGTVGRPSPMVTFHPALASEPMRREGRTPGAKTPESPAPVPDAEVLAFRHQAPEVAQPAKPHDPTETPVTSLNWPDLVAAVVAALPETLRSRIRVGEVEAVEGRSCPVCGTSIFGDGDACAKCAPTTSGRRRNLRDGYRRLVLSFDSEQTYEVIEWPTAAHAGLTAGLRVPEGQRPVLSYWDGRYIILNERARHCPFSSVAVVRGALESLVRETVAQRGPHV